MEFLGRLENRLRAQRGPVVVAGERSLEFAGHVRLLLSCNLDRHPDFVTMTPMQNPIPKILAVIVLLAVVVGCATELKNKENMAIAAGFQVITPVKPDQVALLPTLPKDKVTRITHQGKTYYVLPDLKNNQAYVGGPSEYQAYQQLRIANQISNQNLEAAQMNQMASQNWGDWGGWGGYGGAGWGEMGMVGYGRVGGPRR